MAFPSKIDIDTLMGLENYLPIRVVLTPDNQGIVEHSFGMGTDSRRIRIWWSGKASSFLGEHELDGVGDARHHAKKEDRVLNPLDKDCPISIDWERWLKAEDKYGRRNACFVLKAKE